MKAFIKLFFNMISYVVSSLRLFVKYWVTVPLQPVPSPQCSDKAYWIAGDRLGRRLAEPGHHSQAPVHEAEFVFS